MCFFNEVVLALLFLITYVSSALESILVVASIRVLRGLWRLESRILDITKLECGIILRALFDGVVSEAQYLTSSPQIS